MHIQICQGFEKMNICLYSVCWDESTIVDHALISVHRTKNKEDEMKFSAILCPPPPPKKKKKKKKPEILVEQYFSKL